MNILLVESMSIIFNSGITSRILKHSYFLKRYVILRKGHNSVTYADILTLLHVGFVLVEINTN